jgi:hypothetical protein
MPMNSSLYNREIDPENGSRQHHKKLILILALADSGPQGVFNSGAISRAGKIKNVYLTKNEHKKRYVLVPDLLPH